MASSPEGFTFYSNSETEASHCAESMEPSFSPKASGLPVAAVEPATTPKRMQQKEPHGSEEAGREAVTNSLRQELSEVKESLAMMEEELAMAVSAAREQGVERAAAENLVKSLQVRRDPNWLRGDKRNLKIVGLS